MFPVPSDLVGSLLFLIGIPFLLAFSFFLFPKVLHSISCLSSNKRDDANRRAELLRLLLLGELMDSCLLDPDSSDKGVYRDNEQSENDMSGITDHGQEK